jgi:hypothetical protein
LHDYCSFLKNAVSSIKPEWKQKKIKDICWLGFGCFGVKIGMLFGYRYALIREVVLC